MEIKILRPEADGKFNGNFYRIQTASLRSTIKIGYTIVVKSFVHYFEADVSMIRKLENGFEIQGEAGEAWRKITDQEFWNIIDGCQDESNGYGNEIEVYPFKW